MRNRQSGFTLLEILIAITILGIVMAMNSTLLEQMIRGTKQQGAIVSSQFESGLGLEIMRNDISNAGFGLPDEFEAAITYSEAANNPAMLFNDAFTPPVSSTVNVPRAIVHSNDAVNAYAATGYLSNSDYLVIRSPAVGMNGAAGKWAYIDSVAANYVRVWNDQSLDMTNGDYMIVIRARVTTSDRATLVVNGADYSAEYSGSVLQAGDQGFRPPMPPTGDRYVTYGVDRDDDPAMPFNRADFYVRRTGDTGASCAPNTGTLFKAVVNQSGDGELTQYPLVDCVANIQVVFGLDQNPSDSITIDTWKSSLTDTDNVTPLNALQIKERVKEIQVHVLAHEGTYDRGFRYNGGSPIMVGRTGALGRNVVMTGFQDASHPWDRYRWKIYTLSVKMRSLY